MGSYEVMTKVLYTHAYIKVYLTGVAVKQFDTSGSVQRSQEML